MRPQRERGVRRIVFVGVGVVCLHLTALWLVQLGAPPIAAVTATTPIFLVHTAPLPRPIDKPPAPPAQATPLPVRPVVKTRQADKPTVPKPQSLAPKLQTAIPSPAEAAPVSSKSDSVAATTEANTVPQAENRTATGKSETATTQTDAPVAGAQASVQLPSSDADYLNNPAPTYPGISQRLGEQGKVVIRVLIAKDGTARQAEIYRSSGFDRLDQAALRAVMSWRYVPGQRAGVPQDMWFNVPVNFALK